MGRRESRPWDGVASRTQCVLVLPVCPPCPQRRAVYAELFVGAGPAEIEGSGKTCAMAGAGAMLLPPAELAGRSTDWDMT